MEPITEKRRPTLEELRDSPPIILKLELAQLAVDASGTTLEDAAIALLEGPEDAITPDSVDALRQQLGATLQAVSA